MTIGAGIAERVRIMDVTVLSDRLYTLRKTTFAFRRADGTWQDQSRETYDRGNGAVILLYDPDRRKGRADPAVPLPRLRERPR